jgi:hypothetical protein
MRRAMRRRVGGYGIRASRTFQSQRRLHPDRGNSGAGLGDHKDRRGRQRRLLCLFAPRATRVGGELIRTPVVGLMAARHPCARRCGPPVTCGGDAGAVCQQQDRQKRRGAASDHFSSWVGAITFVNRGSPSTGRQASDLARMLRFGFRQRRGFGSQTGEPVRATVFATEL